MMARPFDPRGRSWVRPGGLVLAAMLALPLAAAGQAGSPSLTAYATVLAGSLNVRDAPSLNGRVTGSVARGDTLCVLRYEGDWAEVRTPVPAGEGAEAQRGFVSRGFISESRSDQATMERIGCAQPPAAGSAG